MSSKRATLHGIELDERPSPLKKRLGDLRVKDTNILGDGNYVDVELEAVDNSTNPKKRKTRAGKPTESPGMICPPIDAQDYNSAEPSTSEKSDCWARESAEDATEVTPSEIITVNIGLPTQFLDVDGLLTDKLEWWNIVPLEREADSTDNEVDDEVGASGHNVPVKLLDSDDSDFFDQAELLELKELSNMQKAMSMVAGDQDKSDEKLFPNSQLTVKETVILLLGIITRHKLSGVALDDILALIHLICPKENRMPKDSKEVFSFFQSQSQKIVKHFYCTNKNCQSYVGTTLPVQERCSLCQSKLTEEAMFLEIPVQEQLKTVLIGPGVMEKLKYRFNRQKKSKTAIEDVYDGRLYKKLSADDGFLSSPDNISFLGNTDGVALVRSTRAGVWPVYYVINELPPRERFSRSNRLFAGIWFGKGKPHFSTFMKPFCQSIRNLYLEGVKIDGVEERTIKGILLDTTMDSPARSSWLNTKQFNGYNGCSTCTEPGEQLDLGPGKKNARRQCHIYPFNKEFAQTTGHAELRTHDKVKHQALVAMSQISERGKVYNPVEGVLGLSWAFSLPLHDVVSGTAVDYMHCICEGAVDQHLNAWFEDKSCDQYLGTSLKELDITLLSIKPISEITRRPRSLSDWKQWKANEKRAFLLYYSLPLLFGRIEEGSLLHLAFLVGGVYRLLKDSISETDLQEAGVFLKLYCAQAPLLYGERFQTLNIHQVLHLKQTVENLGPLWSNSCFPFEDFNGDLAGYFHGSQNIQGQIVKSVCVHQSLPRLAESLPEGSDAKELYKNLLSKSYVCRTVGKQIAEGTFVIGSLERVWDNSSLLTVKEREAVGAVSKIWIFRRAKLYGAEFQSSFYKRSTARNNFTIVYERNGKLHYGSIEKFAKYQAKCTTMSCQYKECSCDLSFHYVALIKKMRKHPCQLPLYEGIKVINHIIRVTVADNPIAIPMSSVKRKCMRVEFDAGHVFVCHLPNSFEKD